MIFLTNVSTRLASGFKLSGLLLEVCAMSGLCYYGYLVYNAISNKILHFGAVHTLNTTDTLVIETTHGRYCVDKQYFNVDLETQNKLALALTLTSTLTVGQLITVVGDIHGNTIVPNNNILSGIYTTRHPVSLCLRFFRLIKGKEMNI